MLPAFIAPSITVPVLAGRMQLGTWQSVCLVDTNVDNAEPRGAAQLPAGLSRRRTPPESANVVISRAVCAAWLRCGV